MTKQYTGDPPTYIHQVWPNTQGPWHPDLGDPCVPYVPPGQPEPVDPWPETTMTPFTYSYPDAEWVDLPCGCKVRIPCSWWTGWYVTTTNTIEEEEEYDWEYSMSCPCAKYDLYHHKGYNTWAFMKDDELEEETNG